MLTPSLYLSLSLTSPLKCAEEPYRDEIQRFWYLTPLISGTCSCSLHSPPQKKKKKKKYIYIYIYIYIFRLLFLENKLKSHRIYKLYYSIKYNKLLKGFRLMWDIMIFFKRAEMQRGTWPASWDHGLRTWYGLVRLPWI